VKVLAEEHYEGGLDKANFILSNPCVYFKPKQTY